MKSAIIDMFHGKKGNIESMNGQVENADEYTKLLHELDEEIHKKLSPELLKLHNRYVNTLGICNLNEVEFYFAEGFKLGLLIGIETAGSNT